MVSDYMLKRGVSGSLMDQVRVTLLVPKDRDLSTLSFVSFKIDASTEVSNIITRLNFCPPSIIIKNFIHRTKPIADLQNANANANANEMTLNQNGSQADFTEMCLPKSPYHRISTISASAQAS